MLDDLIDAHEAADMLGISFRTIIRWIEAGKIQGKLLSKQWVCLRSEVETIAAKRAAKNTPPPPE